MPVVSINSMFFIRLYRLVAVLVLMPLVVLGQSQNQNYVKSTTYKVETSTSISNPSPEQAVVQVGYFDGLGRPIQQVAHAQGHGGQDIITHIEYDAFGRQTKEYLPYVRPAASLNFSSSAQSEVMAFYASNNPGVTLNPHFATTGNPYSEKLLESSPLNRVYRQAAPGDAWALNPQGNDHSIKFDYQTNDVEEVRHYESETSWNASQLKYDISLQESGFYNPGELYKTITKDENWTGGTLNTSEEFKDKLGRVVLKRTYNTDGAYDTYYVYDDYGNLTYVIPPLVNT